MSKPPLIETAGFSAMFHGTVKAMCSNGFAGSLSGAANSAAKFTTGDTGEIT